MSGSNPGDPGDFPPRNAIGDYAYLRDRGYSSRPAVSLVGDRYRLTRRQRTILYRGVCSEEEARRRESRIALPEEAASSTVTADGYNVLLILYHNLAGYPVFLCRDGLVRDAGLSRESLYKALSGERTPSFETVLKVVEALGLRLHASADRG